jgi:hypothetical protein
MIDGDIPPELSKVFNISYLFPESGMVFSQMYFSFSLTGGRRKAQPG